MAVALLKNLGVDETIIDALVKSYGEELQGLEISKDGEDLKLILKNTGKNGKIPHMVTIYRFFDGRYAKAAEECPVQMYKCKDTLEFLISDSEDEGNLRINGAEMRLSDSLRNLLLYLAEAALNGNKGWVYMQDLKENGIIPSDGYQPFSRLRAVLAGYLLEKNPQDLIESNGRKQYRLSVDPKNILIPEESKV